jgi:helix-turn-helix protein
MSTSNDQWLTAQEARAVLKVGRTRLWSLAKEGKLIAHQRGPDRRARYYRRTEVERLAGEYHPVINQDSSGQEA